MLSSHVSWIGGCFDKTQSRALIVAKLQLLIRWGHRNERVMENYSLKNFCDDLVLIKYLKNSEFDDLIENYEGKTLLENKNQIFSLPLVEKMTILSQILHQTPTEYQYLTPLDLNFCRNDKGSVRRMPDYFFRAQEEYRKDPDAHAQGLNASIQYMAYFETQEKIQGVKVNYHPGTKRLVYGNFMIAHYFFCKFEKLNMFDILKKTVETPYKVPKELRPYRELVDLFHRALAKDPNKRPSLEQAKIELDKAIEKIRESAVPSLQGFSLSKVADLCGNRAEAINSLPLSSTVKRELLFLT